MSEIEKKLKREMDAKVPDLKEKIMAEAVPRIRRAAASRKKRAVCFETRNLLRLYSGSPRGDNNNRRSAHSSSGRHNRSREHKPACGICA